MRSFFFSFNNSTYPHKVIGYKLTTLPNICDFMHNAIVFDYIRNVYDRFITKAILFRANFYVCGKRRKRNPLTTFQLI